MQTTTPHRTRTIVSQVFTGKLAAEMPTAHDIDTIGVGDVVCGVFGPAEIVEIFARGIDCEGRKFVCFYLRNGETSTVSGSMKADTVERSLAVTRVHNSAEIDAIEQTERRRRQKLASEEKALDRICLECGSKRSEIVDAPGFIDPFCCEVIL